MTEDLKPCPFCGSDKVRVNSFWHDDYYHVICWNCRASTCFSYDKGEDGIKEVVEAWNRRVTQRRNHNEH